jgi:pyruvate dehydrogenase E2 component (dihydrolipoyllysine-residue acetyltransferase)
VFQFKLPDLGEGIHEGEILEWHAAAGDMIEEDAPLVDVETDKAAVTIPSPRGGKILSQTGKVGDTVNVGQIIVTIEDGGVVEAIEAPAVPDEVAEPAAPPPVLEIVPAEPVATPIAAAVSAPVGARPVPAAPATRRLARELGIDIRLVPASGPAGRVTPEDVHAFHAGGAPATPAGPDVETEAEPAAASAETEFAAHAASAIPFLDIDPLPDFEQFGPVERIPLRSIRRKVAHKMVTSMILVPHVAHMDEADVTGMEEFRLEERKRREGKPGGRLTLLPFVVKAVTAGLKAAQTFNVSLDPFKQEIVQKNYYNIGIAVDTGKGLVVPVIRGTDRKSIMQISADIEDLATRARSGKLNVDDMRGGTFTITNVGPLAGTALIPTINYPEVAILGMGRVQEKPVVRDGEIVIRKILPLTLSFDHRIADGADAARFVAALADQISDPNRLLLES